MRISDWSSDVFSSDLSRLKPALYERSRASGQQPAHLAQRGHENLDLLVRVVERQRRAAGGADAEPLQQRMRALLAGADRHALDVEQGGPAVRVRALDQERTHRGLARRGAVDAPAFELRQFLDQVRQPLLLARSPLVPAYRVGETYTPAQ